MPEPARPRRPRAPLFALAIAGLAVAAVCVAAVWRPWHTADPMAAGDSAVAPPGPLTIPDNPRVLVFGDSWVYGEAAEQPTRGFAYVIAETLGWDATIDGVRGSGYLKPGIDGGSYGERIAALDPALAPDLVIVEGTINDRRLGAKGYADAVTAAWDALEVHYPAARFVVLGPAPQVLPVQKATARIDRDLSTLAAERGWWYISPIAEEWITPANYLDVIDTSPVGANHPSTRGHAFLAQRLTESLETLRRDGGVAASGS